MSSRAGVIGLAVLALAACGDMAGTGMPETAGTGTASACVAAVNTNMAGGNARVVSSEANEAGNLVVLRTSDGAAWRCSVASNGVVEELTIG